MRWFLGYLWEDPRFFLSWVLIVTFSICLHEFAHAFAATRCGDDTAARAGHLSLNPLVQMGIHSLVILAVFGIAWGAVPVQAANLRRRTDGALVAAAGPAANLALCVGFALAAALVRRMPGVTSPVYEFFRLGSLANGVLCVFNLLPVPMFDGWAVLSVLFPGLPDPDPRQAQTAGMLFLVLVFATRLGDAIWRTGSGLGESAIVAWVRILGGG